MVMVTVMAMVMLMVTYGKGHDNSDVGDDDSDGDDGLDVCERVYLINTSKSTSNVNLKPSAHTFVHTSTNTLMNQWICDDDEVMVPLL